MTIKITRLNGTITELKVSQMRNLRRKNDNAINVYNAQQAAHCAVSRTRDQGQRTDESNNNSEKVNRAISIAISAKLTQGNLEKDTPKHAGQSNKCKCHIM